MNILALEPYYGGSHRAFLDGWVRRSRHRWTLLTLPAYKWKWRMRHAAVTFAGQVAERIAAGESWDAIFCSDMLNLAEFLGLAPAEMRGLPTVAYFHENQLTYPVRCESERDYQFAMTNLTTALAAKAVWFNSAFHRNSFLSAMDAFLKRMPDHHPLDTVGHIRVKSTIQPQGIDEFPPRGLRIPGPLRILWAGRWEHDKNPEDFFQAIRRLKERGIDFRLSVIGEQFRDTPAVFEWARETFRDHIDRWGYQETRNEYVTALTQADVIVSTARHEFFGITVAEAIAAGVYPLLPKRLAYPEIVSHEQFFYDGTTENLAEKLAALAAGADRDSTPAVCAVGRFSWRHLAPILDAEIDP